jgi:hypothetical protein
MKKNLEIIHPHVAGIDIGSRSPFMLMLAKKTFVYFPHLQMIVMRYVIIYCPIRLRLLLWNQGVYIGLFFMVSNNAGQLFRNLAQGILNSKHIALGSFSRRIRAKSGSSVAIKAIARKIATCYYSVMTKGTAFVEKGIELYEQYLKEVQLKHLNRMATKHNLKLLNL